jgi:hypothetical protein
MSTRKREENTPPPHLASTQIRPPCAHDAARDAARATAASGVGRACQNWSNIRANARLMPIPESSTETTTDGGSFTARQRPRRRRR